MIKLEHVNKVYKFKKQKIVALNDINLSFNSTGFYVIDGKSGSGKSTLLNIISGFEKPTSGKATGIENLEDVSFVFQTNNIFNDLTVYENLAILGNSEEKIDEALAMVDLTEKKLIKASLLSGGEQQRVALAKIILKNSKTVILDEPFSGLDSENILEIVKILQKISKTSLVIMVSHNFSLIKDYVDYEIKLSKGNIVEENEFTRDAKEECIAKESTKPFSFKWQLWYLWHLFKKNIIISIIYILIVALCLLGITSFVGFKNINYEKSVKNVLEQEDTDLVEMNLGGYSIYANSKKVTLKGNKINDVIKENYDNVFKSLRIETSGTRDFGKNLIVTGDDYYLFAGLDDGVVITDFLARQIFNTEDVIGQKIKIKNYHFDGIVESKIVGVKKTNISNDKYYNFSNDPSYRDRHFNELNCKFDLIYIKESYFKSLLKPLAIPASDVIMSLYPTDYLNANGLITTLDRFLAEHARIYFIDDERIIKDNSCLISQRAKNKIKNDKYIDVYDINKSKNANWYYGAFLIHDTINRFMIEGVLDDSELPEVIADIYVSRDLYDKLYDLYYNYRFNSFLVEKTELLEKGFIGDLENNAFYNVKATIEASEFFYDYNYNILLILSAVLFGFIIFNILLKPREMRLELLLLKSYGVKTSKLVLENSLFEGLKLLASYLIAAPLIYVFTHKVMGIALAREVDYLIFNVSIYFIPLLVTVVLILIYVLISFIKIHKSSISLDLKKLN